MKIVLIGFMCSGKSIVGQKLSQSLKMPHVDTDTWVENKAGKSVAEIINGQGEDTFRKLEEEAIGHITKQKDCVISTGGGIPLSASNMEKLKKDAKVVWLKVKPETVVKRLGNVKTRPLLDPGNPKKSIEVLLEKREPFYSVADIQVDTDGRSPKKISDLIKEKIN